MRTGRGWGAGKRLQSLVEAGSGYHSSKGELFSGCKFLKIFFYALYFAKQLNVLMLGAKSVSGGNSVTKGPVAKECFIVGC